MSFRVLLTYEWMNHNALKTLHYYLLHKIETETSMSSAQLGHMFLKSFSIADLKKI